MSNPIHLTFDFYRLSDGFQLEHLKDYIIFNEVEMFETVFYNGKKGVFQAYDDEPEITVDSVVWIAELTGPQVMLENATRALFDSEEID